MAEIRPDAAEVYALVGRLEVLIGQDHGLQRESMALQMEFQQRHRDLEERTAAIRTELERVRAEIRARLGMPETDNAGPLDLEEVKKAASQGGS
jgi:chaperonin cofactor prefoldin